MAQVRSAEDSPDGRDVALEMALSAFGLDSLDASPEMFARIAYEVGRALAPTALVECMPVLALTGRSGIALAFDGLAPAAVSEVAVRGAGGVGVASVSGAPSKSAAGDWLVDVSASEPSEPLGDEALAQRLQCFSDVMGAARLCGAAQALLSYGTAYVREREQFGKPIGAYQGVAHKLADVAIAADAAELMVRKASFMAEDVGQGAPPWIFATMARTRAFESALLAATHVHQVMGGAGFAQEYDVQMYSRRIRSWAQRGRRLGADLRDLARLVLDPEQRDQIELLWHHSRGLPLPRWAREAELRI